MWDKLIYVKISKRPTLSYPTPPYIGELLYAKNNDELKKIGYLTQLYVIYRKDENGKYDYIGSYESECFITLDKWRELRINEILEND